MTANQPPSNVEQRVRALIPALVFFRLRAVSGELLIAMKTTRDFLIVVRAAGSANISIAASWMFEPMKPPRFSISSCLLCLRLGSERFEEAVESFLEVLQWEAKRAAELKPNSSRKR